MGGGDVVGDDLLGSLSADERRDLQERARRRRFRRGATLFSEGDSSDRLAVIEEGRVKISYFTDDGRDPGPRGARTGVAPGGALRLGR